jgi:cytochrome c oxidase assembly protein subunit 19
MRGLWNTHIERSLLKDLQSVKILSCITGRTSRTTMAAGGAFGGGRGLQPIPPEKGVFPLDHLEECKPAMKAYMECLKANKYESEKCRKFSKDYLECRMERYQSIILESFVSQWLCGCGHQFGSTQRAGVLLVMAGI